MAEENPVEQTSSNQPDLMSLVPDEFKGEEYQSYWSKTPDVPTLVKNAINADKAIGGRVKLPTSESPDEEWDAFYNKLGRPESPDQYELDLPEGADEKFADWYKQQAYKHGLSKDKAKEFLNDYVQFYGENYTKSQEQIDAEYAARNMELSKELKKPTEWGVNYDRNMGLVRRVLSSEWPEDTIQKFEQSDLAHDIGIHKWLGKVSNLFVEANLIKGEVPKGIPKEQALAKIKEIESNPDTFNPRSPNYAALSREKRELYQLVYSE